MIINKGLCIGGPLDTEWREWPQCIFHVNTINNMASSINKPLTALDYEASRSTCEYINEILQSEQVKCTQHSYRFVDLPLSQDGIWVHDSISTGTAISYLLEGYKDAL